MGGVSSQESVRSSWSLELELESGIDIFFIRIFNAETQRRRVRRVFYGCLRQGQGLGACPQLEKLCASESLCLCVKFLIESDVWKHVEKFMVTSL